MDASEFEKNQNSSGLLRFRSAPSSFLENFIDGVGNNGNMSSENKGLSSKFNLDGLNNQLVSQNSLDSKVFMNLMSSSSSSSMSNSLLPPQYPRQNSTNVHVVGSMEGGGGGYRVMGSSNNGHQGQNKLASNLMRQNSSPAGLFSHLNSLNGYATLKGGAGGCYRMANGGANGDSSPSSSRLKGHFGFSSVTPSSLGMLSRISEVDNESSIATVLDDDDDKRGDGNSEAQLYNMGFPYNTSWSDPLQFQQTLTGHKRELLDSEGNKLFANAQIEELGNRPPILSRHLSLPKTPADIAAMEKLLHFQDTIPCKIRAKRGCATHPRSIAERVRRTRISERMRKLQELVPNMDKQTNTADMLDLAVEYIKGLQEQYKVLTDCRANCKCSAMQKPG